MVRMREVLREVRQRIRRGTMEEIRLSGDQASNRANEEREKNDVVRLNETTKKKKKLKIQESDNNTVGGGGLK